MSLFAFAVLGAFVSLLLMAAGFVWLAFREELQRVRMDDEQAASVATRGGGGTRGSTWFRGLGWGISLYAEKPTREIVALLAAGRWREGLTWATPALGALAAFFFWPLLVGLLIGLEPLLLWGLVAFFTLGGLRAAWPRGGGR